MSTVAHRDDDTLRDRLCVPDPDVRLHAWHHIARRHISRDMCMRLYRAGFEDLATELMRQRGEPL
jgi:hypothetical protein